MRDVDIVGAGITPFGKHPDATMSSLAATVIGAALADAGLPACTHDDSPPASSWWRPGASRTG